MDFYNLLNSYFEGASVPIPENYKLLLSLFLYTLILVIYALFIWKFYKFIAKREIIDLNLSKYNRSGYPFLEKTFAIFFYTIEYIVLLPFLVLFWFAIFSIFVLILSESLDFSQSLMISVAIIGSIRITSYINQDLSRDIAKIVPFTVLAIFVLDSQKILNIESILVKISQIPYLLNNILIFLIFLFALEFILRIIYSVGVLVYSISKSKTRESGERR